MAKPGTVGNIVPATFSAQSLGRRVISTIIVLIGAILTVKELSAASSWTELLRTFENPQVAFALILQISGALLSSGDGSAKKLKL